ncbi:MAG TPA: glucokinase [Thermoanaerobaculia bacterium]|nr:glucokinase [Thermoanaerobaculia bacterium]
MRVLAGDIGGTKTTIAVVEIGGRSLSVGRSQTYRSSDFASLEEILVRFLNGQRARPRVAAFGVAGPVLAGRAKVTKLPWNIDAALLSGAAGIPRVRVLNDFVAAALGVSYLKPRHLVTLSAGRKERGAPIALIGAGTGLGQAALISIGGRYEPLASEGGHADFGPRNLTEDRLVQFVRERFGRVTRDRLLSGEGLSHLYDFLKRDGPTPESPAVTSAFASEDRAAVISRFGLDRTDRLCEQALRLFVSLYGSEAGNLALQYRATGGVYLSGGIAPKILPALRGLDFLESFRAKPPLEALLTGVPVHVVREPRLPLFGAAAAAYRTAIETTRPSSNPIVRPSR